MIIQPIDPNLNIVRDGLIFWFDARFQTSYPATGTTLYDLSGNDYDGTLVNGVGYSSADGGTLTFDGSNDYVVNSSTAFNITDNVTLNAWIKESSGGSIYGNYLAKAENTGYRFRRQTVNGPLWLWSSTNTIQGGNLYNDTWYMVTGVFSSTGLRAYIDGVLVASNTTPFNPSNVSAGPLYIGAFKNTQEFFGGQMAMAQIYNKALSSDEITHNYNTTKGRFI